jgi:hypothetical protein
VSDSDKLVTILYVSVGLAYVGSQVADGIALSFSALERRLQRKRVGTQDLPINDDDVNSLLLAKTLFYFGIIVVIILLGAVVISFREGWTFPDSLFWAFQTGTTIGYGEHTLISNESRWLATFYMLVSVGTVGTSIASLAGARKEARAELEFRMMVRRDLDAKLVDRLDRDGDGDGIDRAEFLAGVAVDLGLLSERAVSVILRRFDELDRDHSGYLTSADRKVVALKRRLSDQRSEPVSEREQSNFLRSRQDQRLSRTHSFPIGFSRKSASGSSMEAVGNPKSGVNANESARALRPFRRTWTGPLTALTSPSRGDLESSTFGSSAASELASRAPLPRSKALLEFEVDENSNSEEFGGKTYRSGPERRENVGTAIP